MLASLPAYVYAQRGSDLYVNLFATGTATIVSNGKTIQIRQETAYPWEGKVKITVEPMEPVEIALLIRIPGWAIHRPVQSDLYRYVDEDGESVSLRVNGQHVPVKTEKGYVRVQRRWSKRDLLELSLPMEIHRVAADERVEADRGRVAQERGPIVYCVEWPESNDGHLHNFVLPDDRKLGATFRTNLLGGMEVIEGRAISTKLGRDGRSIAQEEQPLVAIPYFAWANRGQGEMAVWLAKDVSKATPLSSPPMSALGKANSSGGNGIEALNDQREPKNSADSANGVFRWSSGKDTVWVQHDFAREEELA